MQTIEDLIEPVIDATNEGIISWDDDDVGTFSTNLPDYKISVWSWVDEHDGSSGISVQLRSAGLSGELIDSTGASEFSTRYERLASLLAVARRSARNVDEIIGLIKKELAVLKKQKSD